MYWETGREDAEPCLAFLRVLGWDDGVEGHDAVPCVRGVVNKHDRVAARRDGVG